MPGLEAKQRPNPRHGLVVVHQHQVAGEEDTTRSLMNYEKKL